MILRTYIKFWPAEYHSQSAIELCLKRREEIGPADKIESILIRSFDAAVDIIGKEPEKWSPKSRETADHSMPYCVAAALLDGKVDLATFDKARIADPKIHALMRRIRIERDDALSAKYPDGIPNDIEIRTQDGRVLRDRVDYPRGHWKNPMTDAEVVDKFHRLGAPLLTESQRDQIVDWVLGMEGKGDMRDLLRMCVW